MPTPRTESSVDGDSPLRPQGLLGHVVRLNLAVNRELERICAAHGISVSDYLVLGAVRWSPGHRSSPTAICEVLDRTTGGMSLTLDRLERAGWIRRRPDASDGRRVVVEATRSGLDLAARVNADLHRWERALALSERERSDLERTLERFTAVVSARGMRHWLPL